MKLAKKLFKHLWWLVPVMCAACVSVILLTSGSVFAPILQKTASTDTAKNVTKPIPEPIKKTMPVFDKTKYSNTDPDSIWVIVNKQHSLTPKSYAPTDLIVINGATISTKARTDFEAMNNAALSDGVDFTIASSYRSYTSQTAIYNNYVATYGQASTDTFSARPGYSEHQTGLAIDFGSSAVNCNFEDCFGTTAEGKWLAKNAPSYGFILRYTKTKQSITGYRSEPWHFRYVGRELAAEMRKQSIHTLEEFFGVSGGEAYS